VSIVYYCKRLPLESQINADTSYIHTLKWQYVLGTFISHSHLRFSDVSKTPYTRQSQAIGEEGRSDCTSVYNDYIDYHQSPKQVFLVARGVLQHIILDNLLSLLKGKLMRKLFHSERKKEKKNPKANGLLGIFLV